MKNKELQKLLRSLQDEDNEDEKVEIIKDIKTKEVDFNYIIENVKDYKTFCKITGLKEWLAVDFLTKTNPVKAFAQEKLAQIEYFFGQNWKKDWSNHSQHKYYPCFNVDSSGGLSFGGVGGNPDFTFSVVAYFETEEIATYVGKTYIYLYKDNL